MMIGIWKSIQSIKLIPGYLLTKYIGYRYVSVITPLQLKRTLIKNLKNVSKIHNPRNILITLKVLTYCYRACLKAENQLLGILIC